ncbi:MAG: 50S ribosomal protein L6 [Verrucomicrobia bacterium]|nr:50S ribosomal protein L6 [Verrucomicrobiota bacterium]
MSRKGKVPVVIPKGVQVHVKDNKVVVKGPKGTLDQQIAHGVNLVISEESALVEVADTSREMSKFHGLYRALLQNMVTGTTTGFEIKLEMIGVGYRAAVQGAILDLQLGYSHPTQLHIPAGLHVKVEKNTAISVTGIDKQAVGQFAAQIRALRKPEPYQGKGIRYVNEFVRRKAGKAAKSAKK